jgi:hypothetical protein
MLVEDYLRGLRWKFLQVYSRLIKKILKKNY